MSVMASQITSLMISFDDVIMWNVGWNCLACVLCTHRWSKNVFQFVFYSMVEKIAHRVIVPSIHDLWYDLSKIFIWLYDLFRWLCIWTATLLTHLPLDKMAAILADDIFKCIFLNENDRIAIQISLKFAPDSPIDNNPPLIILIMAWLRIGNKPLSEPMMISLLTHICVTRPRWVRAVVVLARFIMAADELVKAEAIIHISISKLVHHWFK